jgi:hypothetical protein
VTSTTRLLHHEEQAPPSFQREPEAKERYDSWPAPPAAPAPAPFPIAAPAPPFSARHAAIIAATPEPTAVAEALPSEPLYGVAPPAIPRPSAPFASAAQPVVPAPALSAARRAPGVHAPPRPIASRPGVTPLPQARPLPVPVPPRRAAPVPPAATFTPDAQAPTSPSISKPAAVPRPPVVGSTSPPVAWELTSGEFEVEADTADPSTEEYPQHGSSHHDAAHHAPRGLSAAERAEDADLMDPVNSEPFPLLRPAEPSGASNAPPGAPRR